MNTYCTLVWTQWVRWLRSFCSDDLGHHERLHAHQLAEAHVHGHDGTGAPGDRRAVDDRDGLRVLANALDHADQQHFTGERSAVGPVEPLQESERDSPLVVDLERRLVEG